jgi:hypothetical protein
MPRVVLDADRIRAIGQGRAVEMDPPMPGGEVVLVDESGEIVAIAEAVDEGRRLAPRRVLYAV